MDELPKRVLYAFHGDRIIQFEEIAKLSGTSLPFVRKTINTLLIPEGYVEEIYVPKPGQKHDYFRLTAKGKLAVNQIHIKRQWMKDRMIELEASGMSKVEAAMQVAEESVTMTELT